ncbi:hypothetical protein Q2941_08465 [Bradyrhizobium sp. UFLA05-153]
MAHQRGPVRRAVAGDNVAEAVDLVLHEVQAARRDLTITGFCMRQAEMLRRIDRAKATLADLVQSGSDHVCSRGLV